MKTNEINFSNYEITMIKLNNEINDLKEEIKNIRGTIIYNIVTKTNKIKMKKEMDEAKERIKYLEIVKKMVTELETL